MLELRITKQNQLVRSLILGDEMAIRGILRVGRAPGSDILLDSEPGISREHFQLVFSEGRWTLILKSRHFPLLLKGQKQSDFVLEPGQIFEVGPYRFAVTEVSLSDPSEGSDRTQIGVFNFIPCLRIRNPQGETLAVHKLTTGSSWILGREPSCSIFVDNPKFSRQHLEIRRVGDQFLVQDLGSSNGTRLNGRDLGVQESVTLKSLDVLQVVDWNLIFEQRDSQFESRLGEIDEQMAHLPVVSEESLVGEPLFYHEPPSQAVLSPHSMSPKSHAIEKKKIIFYSGIGIVVLVLAFIFSGEFPKHEAEPNPSQILTPFDRLSAEQKLYVRQSYRTGQQLLMQGKYEMARQEMVKVHQLVPAYEDSKQIEEMAETALKTLRERELLEAREKEKLESESKIQAQVQQCRQQINSRTTAEDLESCLSPILSLNPEHPDIQALRLQIEKRDAERQMREAARQEREEQSAQLRNLFQRAQKLDQDGALKEAAPIYQRVIASSLPDTQDFKSKARLRIQQLRAESLKKQADLIAKADQATQKNQLKDAILSYQAALKIEANSDVAEKLRGAEKEHRKIMQTLYQEAVLEESIGEVSAAQAKWRKVLEQSYPQEEYYQKSRSKLRKYGG
ncbi:MAG: FHA domain-containing protein [Bdellovibrio sp.]